MLNVEIAQSKSLGGAARKLDCMLFVPAGRGVGWGRRQGDLVLVGIRQYQGWCADTFDLMAATGMFLVIKVTLVWFVLKGEGGQ